jgi:hypothetical protein
VYLNNPGRREKQPRRDAAEAEHARDAHVERTGNFQRRGEDCAHDCLHTSSVSARDDEEEVNGEFPCNKKAYIFGSISLIHVCLFTASS